MRLLNLATSLFLLCFSGASAQITPAAVRNFLGSSSINACKLNAVSQVRGFYESRQYSSAWINNSLAREQLLIVLQQAPDLGLYVADYHPDLIDSLQCLWQPLNQEDSIEMEIRLTDAALHFFRDVAYGNAVPEVSYNGLGYNPDCYNIPKLVADAIDKRTLVALPQLLEPNSPEYFSVKNKIIRFQTMERMPGFTDVLVTSSAVNSGNSPLIKRLWQLGIMDSVTIHVSGAALQSKVKDLQRLFSLVPDGILRTTVLKELNVPLHVRIEELKIALNTLRWLNCIKSNGMAVVVNIPSASLLVYKNSHVVLESRIIVGKNSTRTPTLTSKVTEVVLYPYWMVPKSIATKELLPLIKKNPGYLDMNNIQVLNERGKVVNPANVDWNSLSPDYFPYVLRQSTGCDNSLGLVKLNFYNPYNVYLHDTPWKVLFGANKRYFSHGCMRVEKAIELAHLALGENTLAIDTLEDKGCLINQFPVSVPVRFQMPVFVLYNTAWVDSSAHVTFNEDIYNRFKYLRKKPVVH